METYQVSQTFCATMVRTYEATTGRLISDVRSIRTLIKAGQPTSTRTSSYALPVESKETVYKLSQDRRM
jgi:hypothetical protein